MDLNELLGHLGPNRPYYGIPRLRDRSTSLEVEVGDSHDSLVEHLGVSNIEDMGARSRRGRKHTKEEKFRDANENLLTGCPHTSQRLQNPQQMRRRCGRVLMLPTAEPQPEESSYEGICDHCRRQSPDDR